MKALPSVEQFVLLAGAGTLYEDSFRELVSEYFDSDPEAPVDAEELAKHCIEANHTAFHRALLDGEIAAGWLHDQPAIQLALSRIGFQQTHTDWREAWYKRKIERYLDAVNHKKPKAESARYEYEISLKISLARAENHQYIVYMAGLAKAISAYLSRSRMEAALNGAASVKKMRVLLSELDDLCSSSWIAADHQTKLKRNILRSVSYLDRHDITENVTKSRNDPFLPTRLFVADIYRLHMEIFRKPFQRVIYELSALPFIENPPEDMVSIRRIIKAENAQKKDRNRG